MQTEHVFNSDFCLLSLTEGYGSSVNPVFSVQRIKVKKT